MRALFFAIAIVFFFAPTSYSEAVYVCPMHPHIHGELGDTCPICGMTLVQQTPVEEAEASPIPGETKQPLVQITPDFIQALGITTTQAQFRPMANRIKAYGEVVPSSRNALAVSVRSEGWITDLSADAIGDTVSKDDLLFRFYSPEIIAAQVDYLTVAATESRVARAEQRLRLYGMGDKAIAELKAKGQVIEEIPFYAPFDGTVTELPVRRGEYLQAGALVLGLQDYRQVWVNAAVALRDLPVLAVGQQAEIRNPATGQQYRSAIDFIHHIANPQTRTGIVRLPLPHVDGDPKPGTYVDVTVLAQPSQRLVVPSQALLYDSDGAYIFLALGEGRFQAKQVTVGISKDGFSEILSGLEKGQDIVKSGQFLIDAESRLRSGISRMEHSDQSDMQGEPMAATGMEALHVH